MIQTGFTFKEKGSVDPIQNQECAEQLELSDEDVCLEPCIQNGIHGICKFYHKIGATILKMTNGVNVR